MQKKIVEADRHAVLEKSLELEQLSHGHFSRLVILSSG